MSLTSNALAVRAEAVKALVAESDAAALTSIEKALEAGHELVAAKAECKHGEWLPFLERAGIKERRARQYMQLAKSGFKSATVADLGGIRGALEFLAQIEEDDCPFLEWAPTPEDATDINVASAPLPLSYVRAIEALRRCVKDPSRRNYSDACGAVRLCNIKSVTWPSGLEMLPTWARIAEDDMLSRLSKRADEAVAARVLEDAA